jgi:hypothetical protein
MTRIKVRQNSPVKHQLNMIQHKNLVDLGHHNLPLKHETPI